MYSNSQSYLGGANNGRPGAPSYGQQSFGQPSVPGAFPSQPTGYGQNMSQMQPQQTGYPGQLQTQPTGYPGPMQPQATGYPQTQFNSYQAPIQAQPTGFQGSATPFQSQPPAQQQQQQYTSFPSQNSGPPTQQYQQPQQSFSQQQPPVPTPQQPAPQQQRLQTQPTGMTSSQMANSFRSSPAQTGSKPPPVASSGIPKMRLSFITAKDQGQFETLFRSAVGKSQVLSGDQARDLLLRSKLSGDALSQIWMLSDTTKSGALFFPEFALAMYLCNLALTGKSLPQSLPERVKNEVSSMVDIISFSIPEETTSTPASNAPSFQTEVQQPAPQQPTNSQMIAQLVSQPTGYLQGQPTGYMGQQQTGYTGLRPPMPPMPTGSQYGQAAPLNAQPTGRPGQWGLVNAPVTGLPNLEALQQQMMPQIGRESGFTTAGLTGNATIPWAVTKDEKKIYDNLFKSWDGLGKGFITGAQAIEIFGQSGLVKSDLEQAWNLADPNNKGRLDLDEFAVAMHLIYRKLNGYPIPNKLPPELVPPSTRNFNSSIGSIRTLLSRDAEERKTSGSFLEPQNTGVSYMKNRSFRGDASGPVASRKDGTMYRHNDEDSVYKSSARRRLGADRSDSPSETSSPAPEADELSLEQMKKRIREKQVLLDAIDFQEENDTEQDSALDRKDRRDAEELFRRIRNIQEDIDADPKSSMRSGDSAAERRTLERQLQGLTDRLPEIASQVRRAERAIADARIELFRLKDAKEHPGSAGAVVGTGPGGAITESDRLKARAKAMMQQRSAALSGKASTTNDADDFGAATKRLEAESAKASSEKEANDRMVGDVEESVRTFSKSVEDSLKTGGTDSNSEHERRRWEEGLGVEDEVRDFIYDLQRSSRSARVRKEDTSSRPATSQATSNVESPARAKDSASAAPPYSSYQTGEERAAYIKKQAEQRMAERLAALGLRAPGRSNTAEVAETKPDRERAEKEERMRQAEAEDARREQERQRRLAEEQITPPSASKKLPPPPPVRKGRAGSNQQVDNAARASLQKQEAVQQAKVDDLANEERRQEEALQREREDTENRRKALEEQVRQGKMKKEEERRRKKEVDKEAKQKEERLARQRQELEAAREKERELQRQLEALDDEDTTSDENSSNEDTPTTSQELQSPPAEAQPVRPTEQLQVPQSREAQPTPTSALTPSGQGSNNPFFRNMQPQPSAAQSPPAAVTSPSAAQNNNNPFFRMSSTQQQPPAAPAPAPVASISSPISRNTRTRPEEDDWSVVDDDSSDDEDEPTTTGPGAKHLASLLFGTMAPPRPLSAMDSPSKGPGSPAPTFSSAAPPAPPPPPPTNQAPALPGPAPMAPREESSYDEQTYDDDTYEDQSYSAPSSAPPPPPPPPFMAPPPFAAPPGAPPPPPVPGAFPGGPPPPPPVMPSFGGGGSGAPSRGSLLSEITAGKGLRKVQTKDKSVSNSAGRVLD